MPPELPDKENPAGRGEEFLEDKFKKDYEIESSTTENQAQIGNVVEFPTVEIEANRNTKRAADDLCSALFAGFKLASDRFKAFPTRSTWRALVRARAAWMVGFAEDGD